MNRTILIFALVLSVNTVRAGPSAQSLIEKSIEILECRGKVEQEGDLKVYKYGFEPEGSTNSYSFEYTEDPKDPNNQDPDNRNSLEVTGQTSASIIIVRDDKLDSTIDSQMIWVHFELDDSESGLRRFYLHCLQKFVDRYYDKDI